MFISALERKICRAATIIRCNDNKSDLHFKWTRTLRVSEQQVGCKQLQSHYNKPSVFRENSGIKTTGNVFGFRSLSQPAWSLKFAVVQGIQHGMSTSTTSTTFWARDFRNKRVPCLKSSSQPLRMCHLYNPADCDAAPELLFTGLGSDLSRTPLLTVFLVQCWHPSPLSRNLPIR